MKNHTLVTGGAGFIGSNYVNYLLSQGEKVTIYDNLSRAGCKKNLEWLINNHGDKSFTLVEGDIRNNGLLVNSVGDANVIVHLAGQVAVTTSVLNPREDFEINAIGTFNVLEAARNSGNDPIVIYASTNKVYGEMLNIPLVENETRYQYANIDGIEESYPLDFHSPYGCSKGAGDQYMIDYHRIYGLRTLVFRQSCIYGPRQFGIEDQGFLAWFLIAIVMEKPISIFGNGKQIRDMLHVNDLIQAYQLGIQNIDRTAGQALNIGGGPENTMSIWQEVGPLIEKIIGKKIPVEYGDWRPGDQKVYVSNINKISSMLDWSPKIDVESGIEMLFNWVSQNKNLF
jgi:CDP-paratose 2-epimerase